MNFDRLLDLVGSQPFFDLSTLVQTVDEPRSRLRAQLYRWTANGKLVALRRGMYTLGERYRRGHLDPAVLAAHLCRPSYLSLEWALGFHGLIPEGVVVLTSVTTRGPMRFENSFGRFVFRHIKQDAFFGYQAMDLGKGRFLVAEPEKALLDSWYLSTGAWTIDRLRELRLQNHETLQFETLVRYADRFRSHRLVRTVELLGSFLRAEQEGDRLL